MRKLMTMRAALEDPSRLGGRYMLGDDSWRAWRVVLIAAMGEDLTASERVTFKDLTGREEEPGEPVDELWGIVGRRGGKSRAIAALGVYLSACIDYRGILAPGQFGLLPIIAASKPQANEIFNYATGMLRDASGFDGLLASEPTAGTITLKSRVQIEVRAASFRRARGFTSVAVIGDEASFWQIEASANPDKEILNAVRPSLATTGGPLIVISSPYAKKGEVYGAYRKHFGPDGNRLNLVVKASSKAMNPGLSDRIIAKAYDEDPAAAAAEYGGEFRNDVETFISREVVEASIDTGVFERGPTHGIAYKAFVDPSGGASDSMTLAIAHAEGRHAVLDAVRESKAPFSPDTVVQEFAALLKTYRVREVEGDRYAGEWPRERFNVHGIIYRSAGKPKSDLYRDFLPILNGGRAELLDHPVMLAQLCNLERRTARGGRDSIDHPPMGKDDVANAVAGVIGSVVGTGYQAPVAAIGHYTMVRGRDVCGRLDQLPPEEAVRLGLCSEERAIANGWITKVRKAQ